MGLLGKRGPDLLDGVHHRPLGFGGAALGFAGALLRRGDALLHLAQALLALILFGFQLREALGFSGTALGGLGALLDLEQALLGFLHRTVDRDVLLLQELLCGVQVGGWGGGRWGRRGEVGSGAKPPCSR